MPPDEPTEQEITQWVAVINATAADIDRITPDDQADLEPLLKGYSLLAKAGPEGFKALLAQRDSPENQAALKQHHRQYWRKRGQKGC